ncbi:hypothetical protein BAE44_0017764 [Dichanthelium oligosanthes]|uniref:Cathepsin propeptide inhibitor domain-containing protein n=1 Tax=Dichanthelium oligosanthes TaxID=888268 RepID=A0A1E5V7T2_9POAL|nr:hypothetical protein BAE44_0017764 [Dichanthelium oligosanthes]
MASSEDMWALYERWWKDFKGTVRRVHEVNNSNLPYRLEINEYADGKVQELTNTRRLTEEFRLVHESHLE